MASGFLLVVLKIVHSLSSLSSVHDPVGQGLCRWAFREVFCWDSKTLILRTRNLNGPPSHKMDVGSPSIVYYYKLLIDMIPIVEFYFFGLVKYCRVIRCQLSCVARCCQMPNIARCCHLLPCIARCWRVSVVMSQANEKSLVRCCQVLIGLVKYHFRCREKNPLGLAASLPIAFI